MKANIAGSIGTVPINLMTELEIYPIITPYGARHTRVSYLHAMGIPDDVIARYMGHANLQEFYATYHHLLEEKRSRGFDDIKKL